LLDGDLVLMQVCVMRSAIKLGLMRRLLLRHQQRVQIGQACVLSRKLSHRVAFSIWLQFLDSTSAFLLLVLYGAFVECDWRLASEDSF
jgi:hypothetical protein